RDGMGERDRKRLWHERGLRGGLRLAVRPLLRDVRRGHPGVRLARRNRELPGLLVRGTAGHPSGHLGLVAANLLARLERLLDLRGGRDPPGRAAPAPGGGGARPGPPGARPGWSGCWI